MKNQIKFKDGIKFRITQPECVLIFDTKKDFFHELNGTASELFLLLQKGLDKENIVKMILEKYNVDKKEIENSFDEFITELKELNIIE